MTMRILFLLFSLLFSLFGSLAHADEFLDPAVAFKPSVRAVDGQTLEISYEIAKGYYLYRDKLSVKLEAGKGLSASLPPASTRARANGWPASSPRCIGCTGRSTTWVMCSTRTHSAPC